MTSATFSSPSLMLMLSTAVRIDGNVLITFSTGVPVMNGWYRFGSQVSGAPIPPPIHSRMQLSAVAKGCETPSSASIGSLAAIAAAPGCARVVSGTCVERWVQTWRADRVGDSKWHRIYHSHRSFVTPKPPYGVSIRRRLVLRRSRRTELARFPQAHSTPSARESAGSHPGFATTPTEPGVGA